VDEFGPFRRTSRREEGQEKEIQTKMEKGKHKGLLFLTHAHKDHMIGLSDVSDHFVFCSQITCDLVLQMFPSLSGILRPLEMCVSHCLPLPSIGTEEEGGTINVTLLPAFHCPGSSMFLFVGSFGRILHTGDCRFDSEMVPFLEKYVLEFGSANIDQLILDTTFCSLNSVQFPSREQATEQVIEIIASSSVNSQIFLESGLLGTEEVLVAVGKRYNTKVSVEKTKFQSISPLSDISPFLTLDPTTTRIHCCPHQTFSSLISSNPNIRKRRKGVSLQSDEKERILIKPSTQWFRLNERNSIGSSKFLKRPAKEFGVWHVLFSIHSSFKELEQLVGILKPKFIIPTTTHCPIAFERLCNLCPGNPHHSQKKDNISPKKTFLPETKFFIAS